jgi:predicted nucleic acid-binding Zn ribbon protein
MKLEKCRFCDNYVAFEESIFCHSCWEIVKATRWNVRRTIIIALYILAERFKDAWLNAANKIF